MSSNLQRALLELVNSPDYQPVKPAVIAKKLGLANERARELKKIIKQMVKSGELSWGPQHQVFAGATRSTHKSDGVVASTTTNDLGASVRRTARTTKTKPAPDSKHVVGTFRRASGGFGFVRPEGTLSSAGRDAD
ncbi:MAG TPA: hypothetical protein VGK58_00765, partial [Lacipirellulaceae bacterium]